MQWNEVEDIWHLSFHKDAAGSVNGKLKALEDTIDIQQGRTPSEGLATRQKAYIFVPSKHEYTFLKT